MFQVLENHYDQVPGQDVRIHDHVTKEWQQDEQALRSYVVEIENGSCLRRNRWHIHSAT